MIRAILFDCNGIIVDDEPIHLKLFQKVLKEERIPLSRKDYFERFLAMDDRTCFKVVLEMHHLPATKERVQELIQRKALYYQKMIQQGYRIFPGVKSFIKRHQRDYTLAVVSGALRQEIEWILEKAKIRSAFSVIVSAEDVRNGKPDPECYSFALDQLNQLLQFKETPLKAEESLAIEDSIHGVESAHNAGMKCLAVTNSYSKEYLSKADKIVKSLMGVSVKDWDGEIGG